MSGGGKFLKTGRFDFLFTHHVLEHVYDLPKVLDEINGCLKDKSEMLHILPCGNEGSFEHDICLLRKDGINRHLEDRFFFEDEGHVRRLTTEQLSKLCENRGFALAKECYSNQYHGSINWITRDGPGFIRKFTGISAALDEEAEDKLRKLRRRLFCFWALRYPAISVETILRKKGRTVRDYFSLMTGLPLYPLAKPVDSYLKRKASDEWDKRKTERNGSEMYVFFKR